MENILDNLEREGLELASVFKRAIAFIIDDFLVSLLIFIAFYQQIFSATTTEETILAINSLFPYIVLLKVLYQTFFVWQYGATLGKMAVKIKVVDESSFDNLNLQNSFLRAVVRIISESLFYLGFVWGILSPTVQTWHDKAAKSLVINA